MRERLGESLRHVVERAQGHLPFPPGLEAFFSRLADGPVGPQVFGIYFDLVLALHAGELDAGAALLAELVSAPTPAAEPSIRELSDDPADVASDRVRRLVDADPAMPFRILPPSPEAGRLCRGRIAEAFELMDAGNPELAAEIRALLREVVLGVGPSGPDAIVFDGASAFMLWGAVLLNAASHETRLAMVQALAHESAHNLLFGFAADGPLVENDEEERYDSPLRLDARPLDGVYHATYVTARMHQATRRLLEAGLLRGAELEAARGDLEQHAKLFAHGSDTVDRHGRLTPRGESVMAGARAYMRSA